MCDRGWLFAERKIKIYKAWPLAPTHPSPTLLATRPELPPDEVTAIRYHQQRHRPSRASRSYCPLVYSEPCTEHTSSGITSVPRNARALPPHPQHSHISYPFPCDCKSTSSHTLQHLSVSLDLGAVLGARRGLMGMVCSAYMYTCEALCERASGVSFICVRRACDQEAQRRLYRLGRIGWHRSFPGHAEAATV